MVGHLRNGSLGVSPKLVQVGLQHVVLIADLNPSLSGQEQIVIVFLVDGIDSPLTRCRVGEGQGRGGGWGGTWTCY